MRVYRLVHVAAVTACAMAGLGDAIQANPLPAPRSILWGSSGSKPVAGYLVFKSSVNDQLLRDAWNRAFNAITTLKWIPVVIEASIATYEPFPTMTATAKAKRDSSTLIEVNVVIAD